VRWVSLICSGGSRQRATAFRRRAQRACKFFLQVEARRACAATLCHARA
jgi:hypothetical protein